MAAHDGSGLPTVPVDDLVVHPRDNDLVVGTHGRAIFILDDITALERHRPEAAEVQLFEPRRATIFLPWKHESYGAQKQFIGENPEFGALLTYHLPDAIEDAVELVVSDGSGRELRRLEGPGQSGFHRVAWDLRTAAPEGVARGRGTLVPPGQYTVRLVTESGALETSAEVRLDPRLGLNESEFQRRFAFMSQVNELRERLQEKVSSAQALGGEVEKLEAIFDPEADEPLRDALTELREVMDAATKPIGGGRPSFRNPNLLGRASRLFGELSGDDVRQGSLHGPTPVQEQRLTKMEREADAAIAKLDTTRDEWIPRINAMLAERGPLSLKN